MKKTRVLSLMLILAMALSLTLSAAAYADGEKNDWRGIVWERDSLLEALFITGVGVLPVEQPMPWAVDAARNTAVCFDSGVTEIPAGFTAGCVNMKTVMIPASVRSIGQGVLAISGGLKDVYYQGTLQGLLSIQMFPEDRAALNGAMFHGSKIVYDENGNFEYVPLEDENGNPIQSVIETVTTSDGTIIETTYDQAGNIVRQVFIFEDGKRYVINEDNSTLKNDYAEGATSPILGKKIVNTVKTRISDYTSSGYPVDGYKTVFSDGSFAIEIQEDGYHTGRLFSKDGELLAYWEETDRETLASGTGYSYEKATATFYKIKNGVRTNEEEKTVVSLYNNTYDQEALLDDIDKGREKYLAEHDDEIRQKAIEEVDCDPEDSLYDFMLQLKYSEIQSQYANDFLTNFLATVDTRKYIIDETIQTTTTSPDSKSSTVTQYDKDLLLVGNREYIRDENGVLKQTITTIPNTQKIIDTYASDGKTLTSRRLEWLGAEKGHTADITYNADGSYTRVDTYPDGTTQTRYYDKNGQETTETGSPIVP